MWKLESFNNNTAVITDRGDALTYAELKTQCELLSETAEEAFSNRRSRLLVFCMCDNLLGSLIGYVGFINARIVPLMLRRETDKALFEKLIDLYRPDLIWTHKDDVKKYDFSDRTQRLLELFDYVLLKFEKNTERAVYDELALLLSTSGSTGSPKFVRQSYSNISANTESIVDYLDISSDERAITTLPMNYTYGLSIINTHLAVGATILLTDMSLMQKEFWNFFSQNKATSFGGVPYTYEILDRLNFTEMTLPSLKTMTQAGGKILPSLHEKFAIYAKKSMKNFVVMYGQCEATARMAYLPAENALNKIGSMGIPIPGGRFDLIDINGEKIESPNVTGELVYYGKNVTLGYAYGIDDLSKGDERNGRLETGDMAYCDEDGFYYISGRKKRFLKIFGNRLNLDDCERLLKEKFHTEAVCGGVDDCVFIFCTDSKLLPDMKSFLSLKTKLHISAFKTKIVDKIPYNESGKVLYKELERFY